MITNPDGPGRPLTLGEEQKWEALLSELAPASAPSGRRGRHARRGRRGLRHWMRTSETSRKARLAEAERYAAELAEQLADERAVVSALLRCLG